MRKINNFKFKNYLFIRPILNRVSLYNSHYRGYNLSSMICDDYGRDWHSLSNPLKGGFILFLGYSCKRNFVTVTNRTSDGHLRWRSEKQKETLSSLISKRTKWFNDLFRRNAGRGLINELLKVHRSIRPRLSSNSVLQIVMFTRKCHKILKCNGIKGLCLYLKACQVLLQQSVGKYKVEDLSALKCRPKRSRYGSPIIIHRSARSLIHSNHDEFLIKLWMTLLGVYRILDFKGFLKLDTITKPFVVKDSILKEWSNFINNEWRSYLSPLSEEIDDLPEMTLRPISTSSPTSNFFRDLGFKGMKSVVSTHFVSLWLSSTLWLQDSIYFGKLKTFSEYMKGDYFVERIRMIATGEPILKSSVPEERWTRVTTLDSFEGPRIHKDKRGILAKLALKFEAAGKVRVFAMVDPWTQWVMEPLHKYIFKILECIEMDGTFNQTEPINLLMEKLDYPSGFVPKRTFYSLDLSAATDRLPVSLQVPIVSLLYELSWGKTLDDSKERAVEFAEIWRSLLVDRPYYLFLSKQDFNNIEGLKHRDYKMKYSVGQPMGALSSWAMLAMTHHAIVAFCAKRAKFKGEFSDYAVLGDDIIIANSKVALAYLHFLSEIGVGVGLAKSIISKRRFVLEFAKKFFVDSKSMNMVPIKDCITTWTSNSLVKEFAEKWHMSFSQVLSFLGYGYRAKSRILNADLFKISTRARVNLVWMSTPGSVNGRPTWLKFLTMKSAFNSYDNITSEELLAIWETVKSLGEERHLQYEAIHRKWIESISSMIKSGNSITPIVRNRMVQSSGGDSVYFEKIKVPMEQVLLTPLTEQADYSFSASDSRVHTGMVAHTFNKVDTTDLDFLVMIKPYWLSGVGELLLSKTPLGKARDKRIEKAIEETCQYLFKSNTWDDKLRSHIWPDTRTTESFFDDFNRCYSVWARVNGKFLSVRKRAVQSDGNVISEVEDRNFGNLPNGGPGPISTERKLPYNFFSWKLNRHLRKAEKGLVPLSVLPQRGLTWFDIFWIFMSISINLFALSLLVSFAKTIARELRPTYYNLVSEVLPESSSWDLSTWITYLLLGFLLILIGYAVIGLWYSSSIVKPIETVTDVSSYELEKQVLSDRIAHFKSSSEALERSNSLLSDSISQLSKEVADKTRDHNVISDMLVATEKKLSTYSQLLSEYRDSNLELIKKGSSMSEELSNVNMLLRNASLEVESLKAQISVWTSNVGGHELVTDNIRCPNLDFLHNLGHALDLRSLTEILTHITPEELNSSPSSYLADRYIDDLVYGISVIRDFYASHPDLSTYVELTTI